MWYEEVKRIIAQEAQSFGCYVRKGSFGRNDKGERSMEVVADHWPAMGVTCAGCPEPFVDRLKDLLPADLRFERVKGTLSERNYWDRDAGVRVIEERGLDLKYLTRELTREDLEICADTWDLRFRFGTERGRFSEDVVRSFYLASREDGPRRVWVVRLVLSVELSQREKDQRKGKKV